MRWTMVLSSSSSSSLQNFPQGCIPCSQTEAKRVAQASLEEELVDAHFESEAGFPCPQLMIHLDTESKLHLVNPTALTVVIGRILLRDHLCSVMYESTALTVPQL